MNKGRCCAVVGLVIGVLLLAAGIVFIPVSDNIIHNEIKKVKKVGV